MMLRIDALTGLLLILTAIATVVAVVGRVSADADHETLAASLAASRRAEDSTAWAAPGGSCRESR